MSTHAALTAMDLFQLPRREDGSYYELSEGELLVVGTAKPKHELIKARGAKALTLYASAHQAGEVFVESRSR